MGRDAKILKSDTLVTSGTGIPHLCRAREHCKLQWFGSFGGEDTPRGQGRDHCKWQYFGNLGAGILVPHAESGGGGTL